MKKIWVSIFLLCCFVKGSTQNLEPKLIIDPSLIDIVRDAYGVPHIFAKTDAEVAYGLAWAHAEDDFKTLQKTFLASKAMLGLHTGRDGAIVDYMVHLLEIRELVESRFDKDLSPAFKTLLQGYCDGINAYAQAHPKEILVKKSFPVEPQDLIAYSVLQLAVGAGVDTEFKKIYNGIIDLAEFEPAGSNAFAFNSNKTIDGNVYLAINTHHPLEGQVAWYEAHLSSEEGWNILGTLFPGSPVILIGVNDHLAWTHTVNHPDKIDVYQLEINPDDPMQYRVDGEWLTLTEKTVKLKVKVPGINFHVKKKAYYSIYGPTMISDKGTFSVRTPALMDIRALEQWYWMSKSKSFKQFHSALKMEAHPAYNIIYGDRYDTIFYISNARMPVRQPGYDWKRTVPGNTKATLWNNFYSLEQLPQILNPASGYLYNANHSPFNATAETDNLRREAYDSLMGYETHDNNRSIRVMEMMSGLTRVSYDDFKRLKYDLQLPRKLVFPVNMDTLFLLDENEYPKLAKLISTLKHWDHKGTIDSEGATVFSVFFYYALSKYEGDRSMKYLTEAFCVEGLIHTREYLLKNFGSLNVKLGDYQRLERGSKSIPLPGLPDVLASMYSVPTEDGRVKGSVGECYIGLIKFTEEGPEIETVNCFGASNRPDSPHYNDQMELFQKQQTKKMSIQKHRVYKDAKLIYHPESMGKIQQTAKLTRARR